MDNTDIIIVGGGAAGLMAAWELTKAGHSILILEGRDRLGGRIDTLHDGKQNIDVELGAEFVHGDMPLTLGLLKEAGIHYTKVAGKMWQASTTREAPQTEHSQQWMLFEKKLQELQHDMTITDFLNKYFGHDIYTKLRASVIGYASGYDTADPDLASTIALRNEWLKDEDANQYRIEKGYACIVNYLANECGKGNCAIELSCIVKQIHWEIGRVSVHTDASKVYRAKKVIVTIPIGILAAPANETCSIAFTPAIPEQISAAGMIGYGAVIKILMTFEDAFWKGLKAISYPGENMKDLSFVLSSAPIPTWWTQYPSSSSLLTGWIGGPKAHTFANTPNEDILQLAIDSLSQIFGIEKKALTQKLVSHYIINWATDPYTMGSYAYATLNTAKAQQTLNKAIADTVFFCGEALSTHAEAGTVEAALDSGKRTAAKILALT